MQLSLIQLLQEKKEESPEYLPLCPSHYVAQHVPKLFSHVILRADILIAIPRW